MTFFNVKRRICRAKFSGRFSTILNLLDNPTIPQPSRVGPSNSTVSSTITQPRGKTQKNSQPLVEALKTARDEGAIEADRIADAAAKAHDEGLLTEADMNKFILERS